jgi:ATP-dependent Clp protease ATP-binding subunit ClpC
MFERFTERARQVVVLAQDEARLLKHDYIGTEHLLLGLLREEEGLAARALWSFDVTLDDVRDQVIRIVGVGEQAASGQIPFTPRGKKVLELSLREALALGHKYIGTEHILLGLVREGEGVAVRILLDFDADQEKVVDEVMRLLSGAAAAAAEERQAQRELTSPPFSQEFLEELARLAAEKASALEAQDFETAARRRRRERRLTSIATELQRVWERDRSA